MEWAIEHGGECPDELFDLELMEAFGWSWDQLQATPLYVRKLAWQHQQMKAEARRHANEAGQSSPGSSHA